MMSKVEQLMIDNIPQPKYDTIIDLIPSGENHAVSMGSLARILGVDTRTVRLLIQREREHGHIIAGTDAGLFIPANELELNRKKIGKCPFAKNGISYKDSKACPTLFEMLNDGGVKLCLAD